MILWKVDILYIFLNKSYIKTWEKLPTVFSNDKVINMLMDVKTLRAADKI